MAWVFPVSSRESVTTRRTGWATVTVGAGGGCGFGFSPQPDTRRISPDRTSEVEKCLTRRTRRTSTQAVMWRADLAVARSPIRQARSGRRLAGGRQIVGRWIQQPAPVRALSHLRPELGWEEILSFPDLPAASQRAVDTDEARRDETQCAGQAVLLSEDGLLGGQDRREVLHAFAIL